ncbi:cyclin-dependent kinase inhibitor 1 [Tachysurus ichikawai]
MSSVQLRVSGLAASRSSAPQHARRSVCRSLFGPVDHDELNRDIETKMREISERDQKRWNFNFVSDTPLHGDYEWERTAVEATPAFYQETVQIGKHRAVALHVEPHVEAPNRETCARGDAGGGTACAERTNTGKRKTTRITDFYVKRRKQVDPKRHESASQNLFGSVASERTPRKRLR